MNEQSFSFLNKAYNPYLQMGAIFGGSLIIMLLSKLINMLGIMDVGADFCWLTGASFILFYAVCNSVLCLSTKNINKYWLNSMLAFAILTLLSAGAAYGFSGISKEEIESYKWIFVTLVFGYLVFLSIIGFMKRIVEFAENEDWQAPKKKRR